MARPDIQLLTPEMIRVVIDETLRGALVDIAAHADDAPRSLEQAEVDLKRLTAERAALQEAARRRDHAPAEGPVRAALKSLDMEIDDGAVIQVCRKALHALIQAKDVELAVDEGQRFEDASKSLRDTFFGGARIEDTGRPVMLSEAIAEAEAVATRDMARKVASLGKLLLAFFGDVPLNALNDARLVDFMLWSGTLPRNHGKAHGRNRHEREGRTLDKREEIAAADDADARLIETIRAIPGISDAEKRARIANGLVPRVTDRNIELQHAQLIKLFKVAAQSRTLKHVGYAPSNLLQAWRAALKARRSAQRDPLAMHKTDPKRRSAWSRERRARLLTSTIYRGCASESRLWKPGEEIFRDERYWVPLLQLFAGGRPGEFLCARKADIVLRDGIFAIRIGHGVEQDVKTEDSERIVAIPQILLDMGFIEWWEQRCEEPGELLFPGLAASEASGKLSDLFGKRMKTLFGHVGVADGEEDLYALRKTFSTEFNKVNPDSAMRAAILGHRQEGITNAHYTQNTLAQMKEMMDRIDWGVRIEFDAARGFPVIVGVDAALESVVVEAVLDDAGEVTELTVIDAQTDEEIFACAVASRVAAGDFARAEGMSPKIAGRRLAEIGTKRSIRVLGSPRHRSAVEFLIALGGRAATAGVASGNAGGVSGPRVAQR